MLATDAAQTLVQSSPSPVGSLYVVGSAMLKAMNAV
jgi:hypothetical protein